MTVPVFNVARVLAGNRQGKVLDAATKESEARRLAREYSKRLRQPVGVFPVNGEKATADARYRAFTGHAPKVRKGKLDKPPRAAFKLGRLLGVSYEATRDGRKEKYYHPFAAPARPDLLVSSDGRSLHISGGKYRVTDHGIEDN